ncbi:MAG: hypothetical protein OEZ58_13100 [Gammaproteobacteria bacterium]|nr:hypothetical protein [Gammaproteobacteria bacterium]MDH5729926.1 hypothetical protein [Gammaproteobacteria bacterium]
MSKSLKVVTIDEHWLKISGEINKETILRFVDLISEHPVPTDRVIHFDLSEADIEDGLALVTTVNTIRALSAHLSSLWIYAAPSVLRESLYDLGLLSGRHAIYLEEAEADISYTHTLN